MNRKYKKCAKEEKLHEFIEINKMKSEKSFIFKKKPGNIFI